MRTIALHTLGCKLNFAETSTIGRTFAEAGFAVVGPHEPADVFLLNTCSVTERADRECRQIVRRALRTSPDASVIVTGCYAQLDPHAIAAIDGVDLVVGTKEKFRVRELAGALEKKGLPQVFVSCIDEAESFDAAYAADADGRTRAFLKVQDGCDFHCAFCTIPLARGDSRSVPVSEIVRQARDIAAKGFREIVLSGVNVGDYGRQFGLSLLDLLRALEEVDGVERYRVSSIEPNLLTPALVDFVLGSSKFCNHFHIPLQSGSDTILRAMRRRYDSAHYRDLVGYIRDADPFAGIGADVITGFPGETGARFEETYRFLTETRVSYLHVFTYSERDATPATRLDGEVEPRERFDRSDRLRMLGQKKRHGFHASSVGQRARVLFEHSTEEGEGMSGLTSNYIRVKAPGDRSLANTFADVMITRAADDHCHAELCAAREAPLRKALMAAGY
jgi:threonylcarbamoyladenosine tRNA methylthiotransferase MtaB